MKLTDIEPQQTQEEIGAAGSFVTLSGTVVGDACKGAIRIDVLEYGPLVPDPGKPGEVILPLTCLYLEKVGAFTGKVPKGKKVSVSALCDQDRDGSIVPGKDLVTMLAEPLETTADKSGVKLDFAMQPPGPPAGGPGSEGGPVGPAPGTPLGDPPPPPAGGLAPEAAPVPAGTPPPPPAGGNAG